MDAPSRLGIQGQNSIVSVILSSRPCPHLHSQEPGSDTTRTGEHGLLLNIYTRPTLSTRNMATGEYVKNVQYRTQATAFLRHPLRAR